MRNGWLTAKGSTWRLDTMSPSSEMGPPLGARSQEGFPAQLYREYCPTRVCVVGVLHVAEEDEEGRSPRHGQLTSAILFYNPPTNSGAEAAAHFEAIEVPL
jgi:hypothetical protein